jgi:hypothetical protein
MQTPEGARRRMCKSPLFPLLADSDTDDVAVPLHAKSIKTALVGLCKICRKRALAIAASHHHYENSLHLYRSHGSIRLPGCGKVSMSGLTDSHDDVRPTDSKSALALESKGVK